ncbi:MAG: bifunctional oligoribonuclease/PAP phosphatase NrnA, partial [Candidatus Omnitrophica bacterium]|nr:bifunctional oligoribonuclease/PAP phosphatase NrnA [Candidatus Omnitrophota bacterium]
MLKEIARVLKENNNFLVTTHLYPDGDAIGSEIVFLEFLKDIGKKAVALNDTPLPSLYKFLPGSEKITTKLPRNFKPEVAIVLDTPVIHRLGRIKGHVGNTPFIISIDHHISNAKFGHINWVEPRASAVAEQIISLLQYLKVKIKPRWAVCLYTAIITDTGSFRYMNTTSSTHRIVAGLIEKGVRPEKVAQHIYESNTLERLRSISRALKNLKTTPDGKIAWINVRSYEKYERDEDIVIYPRSLKSVKIAILFRELKQNRVKISFRSKGGVDVNRLAQRFGGGGHPAASGCVVKGKLSSVRKKILEE